MLTNFRAFFLAASFRAVVMELSSHEIKDWYRPEDFGVGKTVFIYNRPFLIYDCDDFTKAYMGHHYGMQQTAPVEVSAAARNLPKMVSEMMWMDHGCFVLVLRFC